MSTAVEVAPQKSHGLAMLALVLLFGLPPIVGWIFFLNPQLLPVSQSNNGAIIQPARPVADMNLVNRDGTLFNWETLSGKWTLITYVETQCQEACIERLKHSGQIKKAVGANRQRIERLLLIVDSNQVSIDAITNNHLGDATLLTPQAGESRSVRKQFSLGETSQPSGNYVIDPNGSLMMHHPIDMPEKMILRDLEKLLKASQDWVKGGQYGHR